MDFGALENFSKSGQFGYIKFTDEKPVIEGIYKGFRLVPDNFNPGQEKVEYELEINNEHQVLSSGSKRLATAILNAKPEPGEFIRITRTGQEYETNYEVQTSEIPF